MASTFVSQLPWRSFDSSFPSPTTETHGRRKARTAAMAVLSSSSSSSSPSSLQTSTTVKHGNDDGIEICRIVNGMWQVSGPGWGEADRRSIVDAMVQYSDEGFTTFDMADIYGPAEDLYGVFINKIRRERGEEAAFKMKGLTKLVPPPVKMTRTYVEGLIDRSRKRMDVKSLDMLQFHWWDYSNRGYLDALRHLTDLKEEGKHSSSSSFNIKLG